MMCNPVHVYRTAWAKIFVTNKLNWTGLKNSIIALQNYAKVFLLQTSAKVWV